MKHLEVFPKWVFAVYLGFFALSIPWYLPRHLEMKLVLGLPLWVINSISAIGVIAFFTVWVIARFWKT